MNRLRSSTTTAAALAALLALVTGRAEAQTVQAAADTFLKSGSANQGEGGSPFLRIQASGNNRALVRFDQSAIAAAVGGGSLVSATLELYVESGAQWGTDGRTVDVHRVTAAWDETATWNCPADSNLQNSQPDCATQWDGGSYAATPSATIVHTNELQGWVQVDVKSDVLAFLGGTANHGWLVKKTIENQNGNAEYTSREGVVGQGPRLVLLVESPEQDLVPPAVTVTAPNPPVVFGTTTPQIAVSYADGGTGVATGTFELLVDGSAVSGCTVGAASAQCQAPSLAAGQHQIEARIADAAGNLGTATYGFELFVGPGPHSVTQEATGDSYLRAGAPNQNQGSEPAFQVRDSGNNRALVRFDQAQLAALVGSQQLLSATLELYLEDNGNNWSPAGRTVDVHRLTTDWTEGGVTWNCPIDADLANQAPDCETQWDGGFFAGTPTASVLHTNGLLGRVQWNVTADVQAFLQGTPNLGWLVKKTSEGASGLGAYTSREGAAAQRPRLTLVLRAGAPVVTVTGVTNGQITNQDLTISYSATGDTQVSVTATLARNGEPGQPFASGTTISAEGAYVLAVTAQDQTGNVTTETRGFTLDKTPPVITATATPSPNAEGWNNTDVTVTFACTDALAGVATCASTETLTQESAGQSIVGLATDLAGNVASAFAAVSIDKTAPQLAIATPSPGSIVRLPVLGVTGTASDANQLASISVNGITLAAGQEWSTTVTLEPGPQTLTVTATDVAGNQATEIAAVTFARPPAVTITTPSDLQAFGTTPITVSGTVDDENATVLVGVERIPAEVVGNSWSASAVPLREGGNVVTVVATDALGNVGTDSITVVLDTISPRVLIDSPPNASMTRDELITVSGRVNDVVMGTVNSGQATVTVNGIVAEVRNRTFIATNVPLQPGPNTIVAQAVDAVGNQDNQTITVARETFPGPRIAVFSGSGQSAPIGSTLPQPLVAQVTEDGVPLANKQVIFRVFENNGTITAGGETKRGLVLTTDAEGKASVGYTLGTRAGVGNNRVEATSPGLVGAAVFAASAELHAPAKISVDSGNLQVGIPGQPLPRPFVAVVTDDGHNRLPGIPVTFRALTGGGDFSGETEMTATTDTDGRAVAVLTLGPIPGNESNVVSATVENLSGLPAVYSATSLAPGDPANTRISGIVMDNQNQPIEGATLRIRGTANATQTNTQGLFQLSNVPVGDVHLEVDGSTVQRPGTYPDLEFEMITVPGADNTLGMPVYLLPLDEANSIFVDETQGGTLTLPDYPGFSLTVEPGAATFPDGTRHGTISVTVVHADKVPMIPNFGQQPRFIVTIQPPGVRFEPPARITHPNVDGLAPGQITELYSFDHDMGTFVATGTATVSNDGTQLVSDPGTGIIKGGWHCGGDPATAGTAAKCGECAECDGAVCQTEPRENQPCGEKGPCDHCERGRCVTRGRREYVIKYAAFIPQGVIPGPSPWPLPIPPPGAACIVPLDAPPTGPAPGSLQFLNFGGDGRDFTASYPASARGKQMVVAVPEECHEPSGEKPGSNQFELGTSSSYTTQGAIDDEVTGDCRFLHARAPGVGSLDTAVARTGPHSVRITMTGVGVDNPLVNPSCSIDWHAEVEIDESDPDHPVVRARGTHDAFPNHELFINGQPLHLHHGQYIWTLCGLFPVEFDTGWVPLPTT